MALLDLSLRMPCATDTGEIRRRRSLTSIERLAAVDETTGVWRSSLQWGDRVIVVTLNSVYTLIVMDDNSFIVSGGWFDRQSMSPAVVKVAGCTCGGAVINQKLIAAPGLHLELGNRVVTTEIQQVVLERFEPCAAVN